MFAFLKSTISDADIANKMRQDKPGDNSKVQWGSHLNGIIKITHWYKKGNGLKIIKAAKQSHFSATFHSQACVLLLKEFKRDDWLRRVGSE